MLLLAGAVPVDDLPLLLGPVEPPPSGFTGMISGLIYAGLTPLQACRITGRMSRVAGELAQPTTATQIDKILHFLPEALAKVQQQLG